MKKRIFRIGLILTIIFLMLNIGYVFGENLSLWGVVKSINLKTGSIVVDVNSGGCAGERTFKFNSKESKLKSDISGKKVHFSLDSSECMKDRIHYIKILSYW